MSDYILTPVGRMIQGDLFNGNDKDFYGKPRTTKEGAPSLQFFAALAVSKTDPAWAAFWAQIQQEAQIGFPRGEYQWNGFATDGVTPDPNRVFAWKVEDGDGPKYSGKEGAAGCWIVKATSGYAPSVHNGDNQQILDPNQAKRGFYYQFAVSFKANGDAQKPGMFVNLVMVRLVGYGQEIIGGPDAASVFGAAPAQLPQGASATPIAPTNAMPAMGGTPAPQQPGQQMMSPQQIPAQFQQPAQAPMQQQPAQAPMQQQPAQAPMQQQPAQAPMQQAPQYAAANVPPQPNAPVAGTVGMSPTNQVQPAPDFLHPRQ